MTEQLQKKVDFAIRLLQSAEKMADKVNQPVEICYSGGKDSDVILELAKMANINYRAIYKNTTIDPSGTIKHALERGAEMIRPKESFAEIIKRAGFPSRRLRFCCSILKEYKVLDYAVVGVRREESAKRAERYKEPEQCRVYSKTQKTRQYFPILEWTLADVEEFIKERNIKCAPVYYDEDNVFHPERRLGCMCCTLKTKKQRIEDFLKYPKMVRLYIKNAYIYICTKMEKYTKNMVETFLLGLCETFSIQTIRKVGTI